MADPYACVPFGVASRTAEILTFGAAIFFAATGYILGLRDGAYKMRKLSDAPNGWTFNPQANPTENPRLIWRKPNG